MLETMADLKEKIKDFIELKTDGSATVSDPQRLRNQEIDSLIYEAVFNPDSEIQEACRWLIRMAGQSSGIVPASIQSLYETMGQKVVKGFTVPAINIRGLSYDSARAVFRAAEKNNNGALIFEIAKSEIQYTDQSPSEYVTVLIAAAIKEGFQGPLFIQGDHFQLKAKNFEQDPQKEIGVIKDIIDKAIEAGFYNIDIDASTLVDLSKPTLKEQQKNNYEVTADLTAHIRQKEPKGITTSVGGEIGEIGEKNSTVEELNSFLDNYNDSLREKGAVFKGISKISVQTGTTHGGIPLPDGSIAAVKLDFDTLENLSKEAREKYGLSGAVQHGASTLPDEAFDRFPATTTAEVHLATGFQNIIYESKHFPADLKNEIYSWVKESCAGEKKEGQTEEQFIYKNRKKGFGAFKKQLWDLPESVRAAIGKELEDKFDFLFRKLNVVNTKEIVQKYVKPVKVYPKAPSGLFTGI
ncbi:MAG: class II fructose-bisphosphate aldolase [Proteobacteria bacterium]|nr:class II fructose-bisphosphate aldolase [Pseudomonadota bacterium]